MKDAVEPLLSSRLSLTGTLCNEARETVKRSLESYEYLSRQMWEGSIVYTKLFHYIPVGLCPSRTASDTKEGRGSRTCIEIGN